MGRPTESVNRAQKRIARSTFDRAGIRFWIVCNR